MSHEIVALTAVDTLVPEPGEVISTVEGEVLVFAVGRDGHRTPLCTVPTGGVVVGCSAPTGGESLLVTGLPGTQIRRSRLVDNEVTSSQLEQWVEVLGAAVADGQWAPHAIPLASAGSMVAPGEQIAPTREDPPILWVAVTAGHVTLCGHDTATIYAGDPAFPLPRSTWLTAGLRCRAVAAPEPTDAVGWTEGLDLWGRLAVAAVEERRRQGDLQGAERRQGIDERSSVDIQEGVDLLTLAVGARQRPPIMRDEIDSLSVAVAVTVARAAGLTVDDDALLRAINEVDGGRDPASAVAAACQARPRQVTLPAGWQRHESTPKIVELTKENSRETVPHALVWRHGWVLVDGRGEAQDVDAALASRVDRRAIELLPVLSSQPTGLRALGRLAMRGTASEWTVVGLVTLLAAFMTFFTPYLLGQIPTLLSQDAPGTAYIGLFAALLLVVVAGAAWDAVRSLALLRARSRSVAVAQGAVWDRIMRLPAPWHASRLLGDRLNQAGSINRASTALPNETITQLLDTAAIFGALLAIATAGIPLLIALTVVFALQAIVILLFLRVTVAKATLRIDTAAEATGRLIEILRAIPRLRVSGAESRAFLRWSQLQARFARADLSMRRISMLQGVVLAAWPVFTLLVIVTVIGLTDGTFSQFITAQTAAAAGTMAISALALSGSAAVVARQSLRNAQPTLDAVPEGGGEGAQPGVLSGGIEVRDIVFRYDPDLPPVLDHVTLRINPGEQVAIVGPSGCGKTTLMRIVLGLENADSGVMLIDGRDLSGLDRPAVRQQMGSVLQSASLLPASIRENVAMGRHVTEDQVWEALDAAYVGDDVRKLAMGLDTPVSDGGGTLSGGQRQRILIARALAGRPRVLILDEATSALDNVTQAGIVAALDDLNITRLVVAHRLSTIRNADRIYVLDGGHVVDEGTYDELVAHPGPFRDLAARQET